jgi:CDGSH-type Zn-finger protein
MKDKEVYIKICRDGPYLVYGEPGMAEETITTDENGISVEYAKGRSFEIKGQPTCLCRCGESENAPYCDGSHEIFGFDGTETAGFDPILRNADTIKGPSLTLYDNEDFCAFARFCDAGDRVWNLVRESRKDSGELAVRSACDCPAGRLIIMDKKGRIIEKEHPVSIGILEDGGLKISGPLWIKGGIRVESADGRSYEVRNRQTLCRCGRSRNKPFCNGIHASMQFRAKTHRQG